MALKQHNDTVKLREVIIGLAIASDGPSKDRLEFCLQLFDCTVIEVDKATYI